MNGRTDAQPETNMPHQLRRGWRHKNVIAPGEFGRVTYNFVRDVCSTFKIIVCVYYIFVTHLTA